MSNGVVRDDCRELQCINDDRIVCGRCEEHKKETAHDEGVAVGAMRVLDAIGRPHGCSGCGNDVWFVRRPWSVPKVASNPPRAGWLAFDANGEFHTCKGTV